MKIYACVTVMGITGLILSMASWVAPANSQVIQVKGATSDGHVGETSAMFKTTATNTASSKPLRLPIYKPPKGIGAPGGRVGGGTRGDESSLLKLFALVPDHLGLTIQEQPTLYWYLSNNTSNRLVLTVNHEDLVTPVLEVTVEDNPTPGIHSVSLMDHHLKLDLEKEYRWFVELIVDAEYPARNIVAGGRIMRIVPPESLLEKLRVAEPQQVTSIFSEAGLWYDAFASISNLIKTHSGNDQYVEGKVSLLRQVDLMEVAEAQDMLVGDSSGLWDEYIDSSIMSASIDENE